MNKNMAPKLLNLSCFEAFGVIFCPDVCSDFCLVFGGPGVTRAFLNNAKNEGLPRVTAQRCRHRHHNHTETICTKHRTGTDLVKVELGEGTGEEILVQKDHRGTVTAFGSEKESLRPIP